MPRDAQCDTKWCISFIVRISWGLKLIFFHVIRYPLKFYYVNSIESGQGSSPCEKTFKMMIVSSEVFIVSIANGDFFNVLNRENLEYTYLYFKWNSNFSFWYVKFCNYKCTPCKYKEFIQKLQSSFRCFEIERKKEK